MRVRREKGFRKMKIEDSNSESFKIKFCDLSDVKYRISLIIFLFLIVIFLLYEIFYFISQKNDSGDKKIINMEEGKNNKNNSKLINIKKEYDKINENNDKFNDNDNFKQKIENKNDNDSNDEQNKANYQYLDNNYNKVFKKSESPKISIIIVINNGKEENIKKLIYTIYEQNESDLEIIIIDDFINNNTNSEIYEKLKEKDKRMKILTYEERIGKLKKRINGINNSKGDYLLFIDADDSFQENDIIDKIYKQVIQDKTDILEFKSFHYLSCEESTPIYQPRLFDIMYFGTDNFNEIKQFHLSGKLIKTNFFKKILENIDNFYKEQNMENFEEMMLLFLLFKKAKSFELLKTSGTTKTCNDYEANINFNNIKKKLEYIIYIKFIFENSDDNVPEKRLISNLFISSFVDKNVMFSQKEYNKILIDTVELFDNCEKINEYDLKRIRKYKNHLTSITKKDDIINN